MWNQPEAKHNPGIPDASGSGQRVLQDSDLSVQSSALESAQRKPVVESGAGNLPCAD